MQETYAIIWFGLLGVLLIGYTILDGFDFGVGILHPLAKSDRDRRVLMNSIGPLWDGNEVWLVTFGGALFAAFPDAYATVFSAFYVPFMLLLVALIFRAVSLEFRSKMKFGRWRGIWDWGFFGSSLLAAFLLGAAGGRTMLGIRLDNAMRAEVGLMDWLHPIPLLVGAMTVALFAMHGAIFLLLKTDGELRETVRGWAKTAFACFAALYVVVTIIVVVMAPRATAIFDMHPAFWIVPALNLLAVANIPRALHNGSPHYAFFSSSCTIAALAFLFATAMFPNLVVSTTNPAWSITLFNGCSSEKTLKLMLIIACIGMPFVLAYTATVYWVFRGRVQLDEASY
ncbi:MAG TPA: cytochrome d ubiquinol oxidase subunit II [Phycisphaerae bacterium]|nr:cytochrome d ubiquinol oxidase subunit II [Phycisphaerae bacterium]HRW54184.1 cytochrome d ubiquinol oxidase subunit II [Phycisphaerae bacterium]